jgi:hypothetical protein
MPIGVAIVLELASQIRLVLAYEDYPFGTRKMNSRALGLPNSKINALNRREIGYFERFCMCANW